MSKVAPQIIGLTRCEKNGKRRGNGGKILQELGNERYSKSITLDRARSGDNEYSSKYDFKSGRKTWAYMCEDAEAYRVNGKTKNGKEFERALRHDAVIGFSVILNPPSDMCEGWTRGDYKKFYKNSLAVLQEIEPSIFRLENIVITAIHRDEGIQNEDGTYSEHCHIAGFAKDENGRYCGNKIDAALLDRVWREYPAKMRKRGYNLDDLDVTYWERFKTDEEYREQRIAKWTKQKVERAESGQDVNAYIANHNRRMTAKTIEKLEAAKEALNEIEQIEKDAAMAQAVLRERIAAQRAHAEAFERDEQERLEELEKRENALAAREKAMARREKDIQDKLNEIKRAADLAEKMQSTIIASHLRAQYEKYNELINKTSPQDEDSYNY